MLQSPDGRVALQQRPSSGIWGGLFSFPEFEQFADLEQHLALLAVHSIDTWAEFRHTFSHYHLDITPVLVHLSALPNVIEDNQTLWYNPQLMDNEEQAIGLPAPVKSLIIKLRKAS